MTDAILLTPRRLKPNCRVRLPGSKSISNRTLLLAALGRINIENLSLLA